MAKGCKKCKPGECEECPEWIFTFADLVMLMMGFFVILWVTKPGGSPTSGAAHQDKSESNEDFIKVAAAIRDAFGYIPDPKSNDPIDMHMLAKKLDGLSIPRGPGDGGKTREKDGTEGINHAVTTIRDGKQSTVGTAIAFEIHSDKITPAALAAITQIADQVRGHRQIIIVRGHAALDDLPETATPGQRMDLSVRRAQVVADLLTSMGVDPDVIRVQGCSTFEPVKTRQFGPNAQAVNRRVEVEVSAQLADERRP